MHHAAPRNPFDKFLVRFALLIGGLGRCVDDRRQRAELPRPLFGAVLDLLNHMFARVQRAVHGFEPGRSARMPSAACFAAAAAARAAREAAVASGAPAETAPGVTRGRGFRLPQGFGWLPRLLPEAEAYAPQLRDILNDPVLADLLTTAPVVRRTLLSLCNMLGVGAFNVAPAQAEALGRYDIRRGWRVREEPAAPGAPGTAPTPSPPTPPDRRQNE